METIKNYLDTMFANLPNTQAVLKAKGELLQMMEDKYNELIAEGNSENTAVGTVISEFGNLNELAEALGLEKEVGSVNSQEAENPSRMVTLEEAKNYLSVKSTASWKIALGIALCILSPVAAIIADMFCSEAVEAIGVLFLMAFVAAGVIFIVFGGISLKDFNYLNKEKCSLSMDGVKYVADEQARFKHQFSTFLTIGILLCSLCWIPSMLIDTFANSHGILGDLCGASVIVFVAIGVFLIVYAGLIKGSYTHLLSSNEKGTVASDYKPNKHETIIYDNKFVEILMSVIWPTIACTYLIISFVTFRWDITWIMFPICAVVCLIIRKTCGKKGGEN